MQKEVVVRCRQLGRPVIVASHLLQSMIEYPTPTRAEVPPVVAACCFHLNSCCVLVMALHLLQSMIKCPTPTRAEVPPVVAAC